MSAKKLSRIDQLRAELCCWRKRWRDLEWTAKHNCPTAKRKDFRSDAEYDEWAASLPPASTVLKWMRQTCEEIKPGTPTRPRMTGTAAVNWGRLNRGGALSLLYSPTRGWKPKKPKKEKADD